MRDHARERLEHDRQVTCADAKVEAQIRLVESLGPSDPRLPNALRALNQMQLNASAADTNRAFFLYDEEKDGGAGSGAA